MTHNRGLACFVLLVVALTTRPEPASAEIQPEFDLNYCCEHATLIVVGVLGEGERLTVKEVLSSTRMGMANIQLKGGPYGERMRNAMGVPAGEDIEVVAFLTKTRQPALGLPGLIGLGTEGVYLTHHGLGRGMVLRGVIEPAVYPGLTRKQFLAATNEIIALTKRRRELTAERPSAERAAQLVAFLDEQARQADEVRLPGTWPNHHLREVARAIAPTKLIEEQVILDALQESKDLNQRVRLLHLISEVPFSDRAFEPVARLIAREQDVMIRAAAITAIGRINNYRAVDCIVPLLSLEDGNLQALLAGLSTRSDSSEYWQRNPKAVDALVTLVQEVRRRHRRGSDGVTNSLSHSVLSSAHSYLHPRLLPLLIDWARSDHPTGRQALANLRHDLGLDFDLDDIEPLNQWWRRAKPVLEKPYDLAKADGLDAWLESYQSADSTTRKMLNQLWLFERSILEQHLIRVAESKDDARTDVAKTTLAELWKIGQLSASGKETILNKFVTVKLKELDHASIAQGSRELQVVVTRNFPFPKSAWVENNVEFGIDRAPAKLDGTWGSSSIGGAGEIVLGSMGGGRYLGEPIARANFALREFDHRTGKTVWAKQWQLGPVKLRRAEAK